MGCITEKLYSLETLREPAFADKDRSKTRLCLVLLLFLAAIACFVSLIIFKAANRPIIIKTVDAPKYEEFMKLNKTNGDTISCTTRAAVPFKAITNSSYEDVYWNYECIDFYPDSFEKVAACEAGGYQIYKRIDKYKIPKGFLFTPLEMSDEVLAIVYESPEDIEDTMWAVYYAQYHGAADLIKVGATVGDESRVTDRYEEINNSLYNETNNVYFDMVQKFSDVLFDNETELVKVDYEQYYKDSKIGTCTYSVKEGWLDIFLFAANGTSTLFGIAVIVFGFLYGFVKKCQHSDEKDTNNIEIN